MGVSKHVLQHLSLSRLVPGLKNDSFLQPVVMQIYQFFGVLVVPALNF